MARVAIAVFSMKGTIGDAQTTLSPASMTASDPANDHEWTLQNGDMLLARNVSAGAVNLEVVVQTDSDGRVLSTAKSTKSVPAGNMHMWGPFQADGWATGGKVQVDVAGVAADFILGILRQG